MSLERILPFPTEMNANAMRMIQRVSKWAIQRCDHLYSESKIIVKIKINKLRWYGHVMRTEDDSGIQVALR